MIEELEIPNSKIKWYHLTGLQEKGLAGIEKHFHFPALLIEDWQRLETLPKYEETEDGSVFILRVPNTANGGQSFTTSELTSKVAVVVSDKGPVITLSEGNEELMTRIKAKVFNHKNHLEGMNFLFLFLNEVISSFEAPINDLRQEYQEFEEEVLFKDVQKILIGPFYIFRKKIFSLKRVLKDTERTLIKSSEMWASHASLFQGIKENVEELYFNLDDLADSFDALFQLSVTIKDERANEVMKVLTVFASVMLPLTLITSFYGMNFYNLPGIRSPYGFLIVIGLMVVTLIFSLVYLNRRKTL